MDNGHRYFIRHAGFIAKSETNIHFCGLMPYSLDVSWSKMMASASLAVATTVAQTTAFAIVAAYSDGLEASWPPTLPSVQNGSTSESYIGNGTLAPDDDIDGPYNATNNGNESSCEEWQPAQHTLFQTANLCYAGAFLIPHSFELSILLMRSILCCGFLMFTLWAGVYICSPDIFGWNLTFGLINLTHVAYLSYKHFPPRMKPEFVEVFTKMFKPLEMDKNSFQELVRDAELVLMDEGAHYAVEDVTSADERLSVLLNGKLKVTCEAAHLHYILPNEFIDSPEWEACPTDSDELFQVTITAAEPSQYLCWQRRKLHHVLKNKPFLDSVIHNLVGKDITQKLYSLNEHMNPFNRSNQHPYNSELYWKHFPRSLSVDVVHTGTKGHVRSNLWRMQSRRGSSTNSDSLGSSPARTSRFSYLSDPGPYRSPLRIPPVIVASNETMLSGSGTGSGSESAYVTATATSPAPSHPFVTSTINMSSAVHSPDALTPSFSSASTSTANFQSPVMHVAFETPV